MKVILREHLDNLGDRGEIVTVAAGYARNYLLPKGLAYVATPGNLKQIEDQRKQWAAREEREVGDAEALAARVSAFELRTVRRAGETGTLYGSVTNGDIADMLAEHGIKVDRRRITVKHPIKTVGDHEVDVKLHRRVSATVTVHVVGEADREPVVVEDTDDEERAEDS